ncbi:MAG: PIN domain-containing protein [Rhizobiaceae bacterium]|nr:PIN domain-containing protein [Rhizobiaceae bacterium]
MRIFVDANIFIEMKDLRSVDWRVVFPRAKEVRILVSMHVVKELDKLKSDRTERRRKRARIALQLIDDASRLNEMVLREEPYRVTLQLAFPQAHHWNDYHILDQSDPDDRLLAHVIEEGDAVLFSDDSGPRIKASKYGITAIQPPSSFRLPPEESLDQKKVRELTERIRTLEDKRPKIMLKLGCPSEPIVLRRPLLGPMPEEQKADLGPVDKVDSQISGSMIQDCLLGGGFGSRRPDGYGMADHRGVVAQRTWQEVPALAR